MVSRSGRHCLTVRHYRHSAQVEEPNHRLSQMRLTNTTTTDNTRVVVALPQEWHL